MKRPEGGAYPINVCRLLCALSPLPTDPTIRLERATIVWLTL